MSDSKSNGACPKGGARSLLDREHEGYKPLGEFGAVVSVRLEPPVKTTLQEGPMARDKK